MIVNVMLSSTFAGVQVAFRDSGTEHGVQYGVVHGRREALQ